MKTEDVALVDVVSAYCAKNNVSVMDLTPLTFGEVLKKLMIMTTQYPDWIRASKAIRHTVGEICHEDCHLQHIRDYMEVDKSKTDGSAKSAEIIAFPTNTTKH